jgi:CRP/FNR family transcriptional regulator, nitrogen oxide reductase regulator
MHAESGMMPVIEMSSIDGLKGFRALRAADREQIAAATREQHAAAGKTLFAEGQPADSLWAVKEGVVHIVKHGPEGREIVLEVIPPGELFGAVVALEDRPYPASAVAAEDSVVWRTPAALMRELCQKHPALRAAILDQVTSRLRNAHERLRSVALERVEQRLARMILTLAGKIGQQKDGVTMLNVTRQELADMVGTTVESTIRVTSKWQQAKIISSSRHQLGLTDPAALKKIAQGEA